MNRVIVGVILLCACFIAYGSDCAVGGGEDQPAGHGAVPAGPREGHPGPDRKEQQHDSPDVRDHAAECGDRAAVAAARG